MLVSVNDTATAVEQTGVALSTADTGTGADVGLIVQPVAASDSGARSETAGLGVGGADVGSGAEAWSLGLLTNDLAGSTATQQIGCHKISD